MILNAGKMSTEDTLTYTQKWRKLTKYQHPVNIQKMKKCVHTTQRWQLPKQQLTKIWERKNVTANQQLCVYMVKWYTHGNFRWISLEIEWNIFEDFILKISYFSSEIDKNVTFIALTIWRWIRQVSIYSQFRERKNFYFT